MIKVITDNDKNNIEDEKFNNEENDNNDNNNCNIKKWLYWNNLSCRYDSYFFWNYI